MTIQFFPELIGRTDMLSQRSYAKALTYSHFICLADFAVTLHSDAYPLSVADSDHHEKTARCAPIGQFYFIKTAERASTFPARGIGDWRSDS